MQALATKWWDAARSGSSRAWALAAGILFLLAMMVTAISNPLGTSIGSLSFAIALGIAARWAWRWGERRQRSYAIVAGGTPAVLAVLLVLVAVSAAGQAVGLVPMPTPSGERQAVALAPSPTPSLALLITSHRDHETVATSLIAVEGMAPRNATVTRDIAMAPDAHAVADETGHWTMPVSLSEGDNSLTFRIADDKSAAQTIHIAYRKPVSTPYATRPATPAITPVPATQSPAATAGPASTAKPTAKPTVAPTAKPTVAPTAKPTAIPTTAPNLGTRSYLKQLLSALSGYSWTSSPLLDGTPRSLAMSDDEHATCEIIGPDAAISKVDIAFEAGDYLATYHAGVVLGVLLEDSQSTPAITWVENQISSAVSGGKEIDKQKGFGNRRVEVMTAVLDSSSLIALVIVTPA